ncbi:MAG TPA: hypothetical protein VIS48_15015 [Candidatus Kryptonia bacterium]
MKIKGRGKLTEEMLTQNEEERDHVDHLFHKFVVSFLTSTYVLQGNLFRYLNQAFAGFSAGKSRRLLTSLARWNSLYLRRGACGRRIAPSAVIDGGGHRIIWCPFLPMVASRSVSPWSLFFPASRKSLLHL